MDGGQRSNQEVAERVDAIEEELQDLREIVTTLAVVNDLCPVCEQGELVVDWVDEVVRCQQCGEEFDLNDVTP